jgi:thiol-disulfide isomerase/thioredoxin
MACEPGPRHHVLGMPPLRPALLCLFAATLAAGARADEPATTGVRIGDKLPAITIPRLGGGELRLAELHGPVVIAFSARWCAPCHTMLPVLARLVARVGGDVGVEIPLVVIAIDGAPDDELIAQVGASAVWLLDEGGRARARFVPEIFPTTFVFDRGNVARRVHPGFGRLYERHLERWLRIAASPG